MQIVTSITQKGQVTIPKKLREKVGLATYSKVYIEIMGNSIRVTPTYDVLDIAGQFKPKKKKPVLEARHLMDKTYSRI
ncbi:AbrB/MazE/SpoVT family DNA-binding domain-containing protein [Candidatus Daviesbacteria bacterium]|nr:AbrB/MazE/SpoVT family DNA-binding domain-containing protein [Candidatus Daviesbacteria bacterium]